MFLDDRLYQIATSKGKNPSHWGDKTKIINQMMSAVDEYIKSKTDNMKIQRGELKTVVKKTNQFWQFAITKLNKDGYDFVSIGELKITLEIDPKSNNAYVDIDYKK